MEARVGGLGCKRKLRFQSQCGFIPSKQFVKDFSFTGAALMFKGMQGALNMRVPDLSPNFPFVVHPSKMQAS
jgi:hypothetical protein